MDPSNCKSLEVAEGKLKEKRNEKTRNLAKWSDWFKKKKANATEDDIVNTKNYKSISKDCEKEISRWERRVQELKGESARKRKTPPNNVDSPTLQESEKEPEIEAAAERDDEDEEEEEEEEEDDEEDDDNDNEGCNDEEERELSYITKEKETNLDLVLQLLNGRTCSSRDSNQLSDEAFDKKQDAEVVHYNGRSFHRNKCYLYYYDRDDKALILGIVGFYSKTEAKCVLVTPFSDTILGRKEDGVDFEPIWESTTYVQIEFSVDPIPLSTLGKACVAVATIPDLIYKETLVGEWLHVAYYNNHKRNFSGRRKDGIDMVDLCSGVGGMSYGAHGVKEVKTVCAVEKDEKAARAFNLNHPEASVENMALKSWNEKCRKNPTYKASLGRPPWIHGSPPCQWCSKANINGGKNDEANKAVSLEWLESVAIHRPVIATFENVPGIWDTKNRHYPLNIMKSLMQMDYQLRVCCLDAAHYGDPQTRRRFFIFAAQKFAYLPAYPQRTHGKGTSMHVVTVEEALKGLPLGKEARNDREYPVERARLAPDAPASTICASKPPPLYKNRPITIDEMKALFSLPPNYQLVGSEKDQRIQLGNSVPAAGLAAAVGQSVATVLRYQYSEENEHDEKNIPKS